MNTLHIKKMPTKSGQKEITSSQGVLDLKVEAQTEIQGIGMGVLSDGTPFLNQRGLARMCGIQNAHIGTISSEWNDSPPKPRIAAIRELISSRGEVPELPHYDLSMGGTAIYAYPDTVCLAVLEYYAFDAGVNCKEEARKNYRLLAGKSLRDFIYSQVGYDPNNQVPQVWRQFHDRVSLTYNSVPKGYFSVFKEIADMIVTLGQQGLHIDSTFVPDISVGRIWGSFWADNKLHVEYGERVEWNHNFPDYFPQAKSNPQPAWCYPEMSLGVFRKWLREHYIAGGKFKTYLEGQVKKQALPASFVQLAIAAYNEDQPKQLG